MTITISQMNDIIRQRYNAIGDQYFTDQYIYDLIFEAETQLAKQGYVIENTYTTTSVADTRELSYPQNTLGVREVRYDYDKLIKLPLIDDPKVNSSNPTGTPTHYSVWDNVIILYPTPDTSGDTIQVRVYENAQNLTSTSTLNVPDEYQIDLVNFVLAHMSLKDTNIPLYREYMLLWNDCLNKAREQRAVREQADKSAQVRDVYFGISYPGINTGALGGRYGF
jgi:hypothetical protein